MYQSKIKVEYETDDEYRMDLLKVFDKTPGDLTNELFDLLIDEINLIYKEIENNSKLVNLCKKAGTNYIFTEGEDGIIFLFSYTYFIDFHKCLFDFYESGDVTDENYNNLLKKLEK